MRRHTYGLCIFVMILNVTINVLAAPQSDWFEEQKRKSDEMFKNFDKDFDDQWNKVNKKHEKFLEENKKEFE